MCRPTNEAVVDARVGAWDRLWNRVATKSRPVTGDRKGRSSTSRPRDSFVFDQSVIVSKLVVDTKAAFNPIIQGEGLSSRNVK